MHFYFCLTSQRIRFAAFLMLFFASISLSAQTVRQKVDNMIELMQSGKWHEAEEQTSSIELAELQAADPDTQFDFCYFSAALTDELYPDSISWQTNFLSGAINVFETTRGGELYPYVECLFQMSVVLERANRIDQALQWIQKAWTIEMGNASQMESSFIPTMLMKWSELCNKAGKKEEAGQLAEAAKSIVPSNGSVVTKYNNLNDAEWSDNSIALYKQFASIDTLFIKGDIVRCNAILDEIENKIEKIENEPVRLFLRQIALSQRGGLLCISGPSAEGEQALMQALEIGKFLGGEAYFARVLSQLSDYYGAIGSKNNEFIYALKAKVEMENAHLFTDEYYSYLSSLASSMPEQIKNDIESNALYLTAINELKRRLPNSLPFLITAQSQFSNELLNQDKAELALQYAEECLELTKQMPEYTSVNQFTPLTICVIAAYNSGNHEKVRQYTDLISRSSFATFNSRVRLFATAIKVALCLEEDNISRDAIILMEQMLEQVNQDLKESFCNLSERRRVNYHNMIHSLPYMIYNISARHPAMPQLAALSYNAVLSSKGTLLKASKHIERCILKSDNKKDIVAYHKAIAYSSEADRLANTDAVQANRYIFLSDSIQQKLMTKYADETIRFHNWKEVQSHLLPEDAAIEYIAYSSWNQYETDTTRYAAVVLRKGWDAPRFVPLPVYDNMSRILSKSSAFSLYEEGDSRLKEQLWQPIEAVIGDNVKHIYYSPAGLVTQIALHAMPIGNGKRLMDQYELHCLSSTEQLINKDEQKLMSSNDASLFGHINYSADSLALASSTLRYRDVKSSPAHIDAIQLDNDLRAGLSPLENTKKEIDSISLQIKKRGISCSVFIDNDACEEAFKAMSGHSPSVIHMATHGFFLKNVKEANRQRDFLELMGVSSLSYDNAMRRSGLMMAGADATWSYGKQYNSIEDGVLTAEEISQLDLSNTNLIVLSACETGLGDVSNYEGVFGLQRAFKQAGVKSIIMSLWKVPDSETAILMQDFYKNYLEGLSPNDALHKAQISLRETHPNPRDWAAFVVLD